VKILLIQPPVEDFYDTDVRLQPLGLCYLKAVVNRAFPKMEVLVKDFHQGYGRRTISLPRELRYLKTYYPGHDQSPFSSFSQYFHFGADVDTIAHFVEEYQPHLVGISSLFSPYYREVLACARAIKERLDVPILVGGSHASAAPLTLLEDRNVDFVIQGEGERPFVAFLQALTGDRAWERVPNLGWKDKGRCVFNPVEPNYPFASLPFPDLSNLDPQAYLFQGQPMCFVTTSRGCPHRCAFCSVHLTFGHGYQHRDPADIVEEIRLRYAQGYRVFDFEDDNLTLNKHDFSTLLDLLMETFADKQVRFLAMNGISYMHLDRELLAKMHRAGFTHVNLSLVSAQATTLARMHRPHPVARFQEVALAACAQGMHTVAYLILGLPGETLDEMIQTLVLLARLPVLVGASIFYLTPGSFLARDFPPMTARDIFLSRSTAMAVETSAFTRDDLYTLFVTARIINFLKGCSVDKEKTTVWEVLEDLRRRGGKRDRLGADILFRLRSQGVLYGADKNTWYALPGFRKSLFDRVMACTREIVTLEGRRMACGGWE
jgi:radical SAM superfamily enzyme YgiQ (UPF0313 family)